MNTNRDYRIARAMYQRGVEIRNDYIRALKPEGLHSITTDSLLNALTASLVIEQKKAVMIFFKNQN